MLSTTTNFQNVCFVQTCNTVNPKAGSKIEYKCKVYGHTFSHNYSTARKKTSCEKCEKGIKYTYSELKRINSLVLEEKINVTIFSIPTESYNNNECKSVTDLTPIKIRCNACNKDYKSTLLQLKNGWKCDNCQLISKEESSEENLDVFTKDPEVLDVTGKITTYKCNNCSCIVKEYTESVTGACIKCFKLKNRFESKLKTLTLAPGDKSLLNDYYKENMKVESKTIKNYLSKKTENFNSIIEFTLDLNNSNILKIKEEKALLIFKAYENDFKEMLNQKIKKVELEFINKFKQLNSEDEIVRLINNFDLMIK